MSSLASTQADGYYVPPEYLDSGAYKKQSINQFVGSKGHNQYLQNSMVWFELPYHGMYKKCQVPVDKGTRFNAQKSHVGLGSFGIHKAFQEFDTLATESLGVMDTDIGQSIVPSSSRKESSSNGRLDKLEEAATSS
eukprot:scaffold64406_cov53-Attheya_sp.AAC.4